MEPEGSLQHSQVPSTFPYPEPAGSSPSSNHPLTEDPFQYCPPIYPWVFQVVCFRFPHQNPVYASPLPHTCHIPRPTHSSLNDHPNNICWGAHIKNFYIHDRNVFCNILVIGHRSLGISSQIWHCSHYVSWRNRVWIYVLYISDLECVNTLRTGACKLFKCTFPGSKEFKSTFILCFFKNL